ncbi:thioredoxin domain-containing protein [Roseomonas sp. F4]|jgi:protein-disulfide isomerase|uniref:DsbA family protein n=2 Tax=Falsiroseomonas TaxID=2870713 RepID=A0ABS6HIZ6_9PROT|nr:MULTISPECIES: thioredoxin domain-containing protein [Acetobacteraceae]MBU8547225.1 DsbA family protein [Roseomonas oleicola]NKE45261.1 DsbA family protein [Falsiroseomonas frigidaquae]
MSKDLSRRGTLTGLGVLVLSAPALGQQAAAPPFAVTEPGPETPRPLPSERAIGREDAPVTVIEFHSLTCGNCANFHTQHFPRIKAAYVDPGLVRFVLRDFPLDRVAVDAAALVHCAGPERFEALLSVLYTNKEAWAHSPDARGWLRRTAGLAGLSPARLEACWTDRGFSDPIIASRLQAEREFSISATPSFVIGGQVQRGVLTFERFAQLVQPLLPPGAVPAPAPRVLPRL